MTTISIADVDKSRCAFARKKIGTPTAAAREKQYLYRKGQDDALRGVARD